jgi:hypothetical protein
MVVRSPRELRRAAERLGSFLGLVHPKVRCTEEEQRHRTAERGLSLKRKRRSGRDMSRGHIARLKAMNEPQHRQCRLERSTSVPHTRRRIAPRRVLNRALDLVEAPTVKRDPRPCDRQSRIVESLVVKRREPFRDRRQLALVEEPVPVARDQLCRVATIAGGDRVRDRLRDRAASAVPGRSTSVQHGNPVRIAVAELVLEKLGEERVIAIPLALVVERVEKEIRSLDPVEHSARSGCLSHVVAERAAEAFEDRGLEQETLDGRFLALEHLRAEVVDDLAVVARECLDERMAVAAAPQRQRREIETGGPPFGPLLQAGDVASFELEAEGVVQERESLLLAEPKLLGSELVDLAARAETGHTDGRV